MKTNCWLILGTMLATTAVAQVNTNKLPEIPPPATTTPAVTPPVGATDTMVVITNHAPAKKAGKAVKAKKKGVKQKSAAKAAAKKAPALPTGPVTLVPGPATVAADNVNLRGQAGLKGEVVGHVKKGDTVTVLSEITLDKPKAGEPAQWAKIGLPAGTKVWVDAKYVDAANKVVTAKKLNLRGGPGENYSVLGVIEKGAAITTITNQGDWMQIQTPASAFAFVAASYLKQDAGMESNVPTATVAASTENVPPPAPVMPPTQTTVTETPPIAPPAATPPAAETPAPAPAPVAPPAAPEAAAANPAPPATLMPTPTLAPEDTDTNLPPPPPRIVTHEGDVRHSVSLVAPTYYELFDPVNDKAINYLYSPSTNLNLSRYNGLHITVTGEEGMDVRWADTPVLSIQKIYVLPPDVTKPAPVLQPIKSHK